ncbi:hypothetical protein GOV10_00700 [Candidatus Woesearchaeota archaeon]|nr:hypothetical protein [Candidatus Woesearchaeota archaeon]
MSRNTIENESEFRFKLNGKPGRILSAIVNMDAPIRMAEREVGGIARVERDLDNTLYTKNGQYSGRRIGKQFSVEVSGAHDTTESYQDAMLALLSLGKESGADAYELTGLMSYPWDEERIIDGTLGQYIGFASAFFFKQNRESPL